MTNNREGEERFEDLAGINYNLYFAGTVRRADTGENWTVEQAEEEIKSFIDQELQKARAEAWQEAVDLADKIELREPDGGTKQWMAFKAFRNTLRDKIKDQSELDQPNK